MRDIFENFIEFLKGAGLITAGFIVMGLVLVIFGTFVLAVMVLGIVALVFGLKVTVREGEKVVGYWRWGKFYPVEKSDDQRA